MVSKLSVLKLDRPGGADASKLVRDEIRQVITDTVLLCEGVVPLDRWLEASAADEKVGRLRGR